MNSKVWLTVFCIIAAILIGAAGYYCFGASKKYKEAINSWDAKVATIQRLERKVPYPNEENQEALDAKVKEYRQSVTSLYESLKNFQKELNTQLLNTEFQQLVLTRVSDFRQFAKDRNLSIQMDTEFQLGFDAYSNTLPAQELVPVLDYELKAIDFLLREMVNAGGEALIQFDRDPIPGEPGALDEQSQGVVHKYPVRLRYRGPHSSLQKLINTLANNKEFFYVVRVMKVANSNSEGPQKIGQVQEAIPRYVNPETQERADLARLTQWGYPTATATELAAKAKEEGFELASKDAQVLMGQERLTVFMLIDITRFVEGEEHQADEKSSGKSKGKGRK